jgi:hypothetical protein
MAKHKTGGWFNQTTRHSKARKYGKAGGQYLTEQASKRVDTILKKHPEYKNLSFKQLKGKGIFLKYQSDSDKDGVKNIHDCKPLNKKEQDLKETAQKVGSWIGKEAKAVGEWAKKEAPIVKEWVKKEGKAVGSFVSKEAKILKTKAEEEIKNYQERRREAVRKAVEEATKQNAMVTSTPEQQEKIVDDVIEIPEMQETGEATNYQNLNISHIFTKPELSIDEASRIAKKTTEAMTKAEHQKIDDLADVDVKELSDSQLKTIAIRLGTGFFGQGGKYEDEIKRRIRERERIETDLRLELQKAQAESTKRINEYQKEISKVEKGGYIWDDIFK